MAYYACKSCEKELALNESTCPHCGMEKAHQRCRSCQEIVPRGNPKCPSCRVKAPLLSKNMMFFRSFVLPALFILLISMVIGLKR